MLDLLGYVVVSEVGEEFHLGVRRWWINDCYGWFMS